MSSLSLDARGVLSYAQDSDEPLTVETLKAQGWSERRSRSALRELVTAGKLSAAQTTGARGRFQPATYSLSVSDGTATAVRTDVNVGTDESDRTVKNAAAVSIAPAHESVPVREELNTQTQEKENAKTARTRLVPPGRTKPHSRKASPEKPSARAKPYDDIERDVRWGLINAWCSNLRAQPIGAFKSDANHETAAELVRAGYGEQDVERFVQAKRNDRWWDGKTLTLQKVAELLPEWLAANKPKLRISKAYAFLSEYELNAMRPTGTEYLVTYVQ